MRRQARHMHWFLGCALSLAPGLAAAEEPVAPYPACAKTPTEGDIAAAKGAFQAGNASFNEADYSRAINYWEDAYRRDCTAHINLLNLARAYELDGQKLHAANALETFLQRKPGTPDEDQIQRRIAKLREEGAAQTPVAASVAQTEEPPEAPAPPVATQAEAPTEGKPAPSKSKSIIPLIVAGVGGAVAIGGTVAYIGAKSDLSAAQELCPNPKQCESQTVIDEGNDARSRAITSGWIAAAGGAVLAGGLVWYFVQKPSSESARVEQRGLTARVAPAFGAGYGGVQLSGRF
jgi:tetratricopeptide (TPR) repeat protein